MKTIRTLMLMTCCAIMCVSGLMIVHRSVKLHNEEREYETLRAAIMKPEKVEETRETDAPLEKAEAQEVTEPAFVAPQELLDAMSQYPDMIRWITIENTEVDLPIMQNEDNEYYLHRDFKGNDAISGSIYMDANHDISEKGLHSIYGHHMRDGSMFKDVSKFINTSYMEAHQNITIMTVEKELHLKPVYCYAAKADGTYRQVVTSHAQVVQFIMDHTGLEIDTDDLYVLITCSYGSADERTYLYCVPVEAG